MTTDTTEVDDLDEQQLDAEEAGAADFDAFFAEQDAKRSREAFTLYGRRYELPDSTPIMFTLQMERVQNSSDPQDVRKMLATVFGTDTLDVWAEKGMTDRQFGIVLIYSAANMRTPGSVTMARAAELHDEQERSAAAEGKAPAPNRAARRAKPKGKRRSSGKR
ncbi:hypothetical protein KQH42_07335 [Streptomyces sp. CHA1]|uniref:hypothetical protein n=1 Tax=Streptomyces TaxID=1883 RepID=UPI001BFC6080|nr:MULTISPECIES: hypothetical protein [unclassified Streptomyces]MBT3157347.1 hypothetical protein [Streptomyces sp. G11C]MCO6700328.1 hypothetical protein [Streptomyces sp. CHB9.2]MCO6706464.1 hypothetical protein [Streptomyces sp. CHA3]MCO6712206.1 hypothetical protein [Streptomyces sp. CHB19.2]MCO6718640.1 hypothetical protein [Streptomyces sp. Vc714c-19]